jgi:uncharacterized protein YjcR
MSQNKPHDRLKYCGARTRAGTPCKRPAGWGTDHVGDGRCKLHGGKSTGAPPEKMQNNQNAKKHGFFSKYIPKETLEIMGMLDEKDPADLLWDQIMIQYAAIIRAQSIMFVTDKNEMIKELKKEKHSESGSEIEYEFQFAWDRQATFLNAQSRAIAELRSSIKQFLELAHEQDERRLKLEKMQLNIEKTKAELDKLNDDSNDKPIEIVIKRKGEGE